MKKRILLIIFLGLIFAYLFFFNGDSNQDLKDNYYQAVNQKILEKNPLKKGEYSWSYFTVAQEKADDDTTKLVEEILDGSYEYLDSNEIKVIQSVYDKALDMEARNEEGIEVLTPYLDKVWSVSSVEELKDAIVVIEQELGIDILTNVEIMVDYKDNRKNLIYFVPVTFAFGASSDYIVDDDYMTYKAYLRRACVQLWKVYGKDTKESREIVKRVFSFYEAVSRHSKLANELEDISSYYNVVTKSEFLEKFDHMDEEYLSRRGLNNKNVYSIVDESQYEYLNDSLTLDNLNIWKEVIITKILSSYASYSSSDYVQIVDDLNVAILGEGEDKTSLEKAIDLIKELFSDEIDKGYENKFLKSDYMVMAEVEEMFLEIKKVYKKRLKNNKWLSDDAIEKALLKLEMMDVIIGIDDETISYDMASNLEMTNDSLIEVIIQMQQLAWKKDLVRLDSGEQVNLVSQGTVNAYYQPLNNSIVIPVAFFELVGENKKYYQRLGTLGMILAHEVTHGFDGNGSLFDENGNLNNWWTEKDKKVFEKLQDDISIYYSKYEVLDGKYINGEKTVNENIADLGAIACISEIANYNGASEEELKEMFTSFAKMWASNESEEYMELLLLQDVHSPNQFRVNAVLSSTDVFYQVYDIYPWNEMWISSDERVFVW